MLPVGTLLQGGKYRIDSYLSSGGFGNTYVATNLKFEEQVAIKEFFMRGISQRDGDSVSVSVSNETNVTQFFGQMEKFRKEARRLRRLRNEHIVAVHDLFDENETAYYEMDLIKGESLSERLRRTGQALEESEVMTILEQVLDALAVVHAQGLYHLDLKPANIMIDQNGCALLIDFGASKQLSTGEGYSVSTSSALAYTPGYAPLEQIDQNIKCFGPWTDIYALGATLYKLLTNLTPPPPSELISSRSALNFPMPVSPRLQQLITWMMKPAYEERPQSVAEVMRSLNSSPKNSLPPIPSPKESGVNTPRVEEETDIVAKQPKPKDEETEISQNPPSVSPSPIIPQEAPFAKKKKKPVALYAGIGVVAVAAIVLAIILLFSLNKIGKTTSVVDTLSMNSIKEWKFQGSYSEGLATVEDDNEKKGFIDKTGKLVILCKWKKAGPFSEGLASVADDNGKWGFIDKTGLVVIPCKWKLAWSFSEGLASVEDDNEKNGFIDKTGKLVIPCKWKLAWSFSEGLAIVEDDNEKKGFIDKTGKLVIPCKWKSAGPFSEGLATVQDDNWKFGFIDKTGKVVIPCKWRDAWPFHEGLASVEDNNGKWGYIDKTGKVVIPCKWKRTFRFSEDLAKVMDDNWKWGYIDKTGKLVIPCQWKEPTDFSEGLASVEDGNGVWHKIDKTGKIVE